MKAKTKKAHQVEIPGTGPGAYNFIVRFMDAETDQEVYSCPALSAGDLERIAVLKFPRWRDSYEDGEEGKPKRRIQPPFLRVKEETVTVWIDHWVAGALKAR